VTITTTTRYYQQHLQRRLRSRLDFSTVSPPHSTRPASLPPSRLPLFAIISVLFLLGPLPRYQHQPQHCRHYTVGRDQDLINRASVAHPSEFCGPSLVSQNTMFRIAHYDTAPPSVAPSLDTSHHDPKIANANQYTVRFMIRLPPDDCSRSAAALSHFACLKALQAKDPSLTIYTNSGQALTTFPHHTIPPFRYQILDKDEAIRRQPAALVVHRIYSRQPFHLLRKSISSTLYVKKTRMHQHLWTEDEARIVNLGFLLGTDPHSTPRNYVEQNTLNSIMAMTNTPLHKIPKFHCGFIRPCYIDKTGTKTKTASYDIQCKPEDAQTLISLLTRTYDHHEFCFHKIRHHSPTKYSQAITQQNNFLRNSRVIPIAGLFPDSMSDFKAAILNLHGSPTLVPHPNPLFKGRWNIMTTNKHFKSVTQAVNALIRLFTPITPGNTPLCLAFKTTPWFFNPKYTQRNRVTHKPAPTNTSLSPSFDSTDFPPLISNHESTGSNSSDLFSLGSDYTQSSDENDYSQHITLNDTRLQDLVYKLTNKVHSICTKNHSTSDSAIDPNSISQMISITVQTILEQSAAAPTA